MGLEHEVRGLVDDLYATALDETLLAGWVWRATRLMGGICGTFHIVDSTGHVRRQVILHDDHAALERYVDEGIGRLDPQIPWIGRLSAPQVYADTDHLDLSDPATREYVSWQRSNGNLRHYLTAATRPGGDHVAGLSVHRAVADGATPHAARRIMQRLLPDIGRALEMGVVHARKLDAAWWDGLLVHRAEPCLLLGDDAQPLRATPAMERLWAAGDGLSCTGGRLGARDPASAERLAGFVGALAAGVAGPAVCRVARPSGKAPYVLTGYPLPRRARLLASVEAAALVVAVDPAAAAVPSAPPWRDAFALSAREAETAALLMAGHSIETAAATLGISAATARIHLRRLFAKTGTGRQGDLIRLLSRLT